MKKFTRIYYAPLLITAFLICSSPTPVSAKTTTNRKSITVINFTNRSHDKKWDWLKTGLADMLISDLHRSGKFQVVTREDMQALFQEMDLSEAGIVKSETASRFGKTLRVDWAVFGSYTCDKGKIQIECHIIDVNTQKIRRIEFVKGRISDALSLQKDLSLKIVNNFNLKLNKKELRALSKVQTKSLKAAEYYYNGIKHYDNGKYLEALRNFRQATASDESYHEARFHVGKIYYDCGEYKHSLVEFEKVAEDDPDKYYTQIACFTVAHIKQNHIKDLASAAEYYISTTRADDDKEITPLSPIASLRAALIYQELGQHEKAFETYQLCLKLSREGMEAGDYYHQWTGSSRNTRWVTSYCRKRIAAYLLQQQLINGTAPDKLDHYIMLTPQHNTIIHDGSGPGGIRGNFHSKDRPPHLNRQGLYYFFAKPGYAITSLKITFNSQPALAPNGSRAQPTMQYCNLYIGDICAKPRTSLLGSRDLDLTITGKRSTDIELRHPTLGCWLSIGEGYDVELTELKVEVELIKAPESIVPDTLEKISNLTKIEAQDTIFLSLSAYRDYRGKIHALSSERSPWTTSSSLSLYCPLYLSRRWTSDIWISDINNDSAPGEWRKPPINSLRYDYHPSLTQDNNGRYWIVFCSRRNNQKGVKIWITSSADCKTWTPPRRLQIDAEWENKHLKLDDWNRFKRMGSPRLLIDKQGTFWLSFWLSPDILITNSIDGYTWRKPAILGPQHFKTYEHSIVLCENDKAGVTVAFKGRYWELKPNRRWPDASDGLLIAEVDNHLQSEKRIVKPNLIQSKYGWIGKHTPLAIRQFSDGRYLIIQRRKQALYASVSRNLIDWDHHKVPNSNTLNPKSACLLDRSMQLTVVSSEKNKLTTKKYSLTQILSANKTTP